MTPPVPIRYVRPTLPRRRAAVAQKPVELILMRSLVFYNEAAEALLGRRYDETGGMSPDEKCWTGALP